VKVAAVTTAGSVERNAERAPTSPLAGAAALAAV